MSSFYRVAIIVAKLNGQQEVQYGFINIKWASLTNGAIVVANSNGATSSAILFSIVSEHFSQMEQELLQNSR